MARWSQRSRLLTAAIAGAVATTFAVQAWTLIQSRERTLAVMEVRAANRAQATLDGVRAVMARIDLELLAVRDQLDPEDLLDGPSPATRAKEEQVRALLLRYVARVPQLARIHVAGASGEYVYSTVTPVPHISVADRRYFQELRAATVDRPISSEVLVGRSSGIWGITPSRRVLAADGRFAGVIIAVVEASTLDRELKAVDQAEWTLALFDRDHRLVASAPAMPGKVGTVFPDGIIGRAATQERPRFRGPALGGDAPAVWAAESAADLQLTTVAGYGQDLALRQWRRDLRMHLLVAAFLAGACAVALVLHERHRRSTDSIRSLHERMKLAASEVHLGIWEWDPGTDALQWDEAMGELHRCAPGGAPWTRPRWLEQVAPADRERLAQALEGVRRSAGRFEVQVELAGAERHLRLAGVAAGEGAPAPHLVYGIAWDVTSVERAHQALTQAQKLDALGHLAGGVAHDFNNMLSAILASTAALAESLQDPDDRELVATIDTAATRAAELTQKLLAFGRKGKMLSEVVDLHLLVHETRTILARTIDRRITVVAALEAARSTVLGDPAQLHSALVNLGVNARDAMPAGGELRFATAVRRLGEAERRQGAFELEPGDYLEVSVTDTGTGIGEDVLPRVFDPYFTTKPAGKGTGLGLAAVFGTMAAHRGAVTVKSRLGEGTRFTLLLPLCEPRPADARPPPAPRQARPARGRVLVVDDEEVVRTSTAALLRALGHEPMTAAGPSDALELFRLHHHTLDAVLVDMVLASGTGLDLAVGLRAVDDSVPLVLMSGYTRAEPLGELARQGLAAFLQKPFTRADVERVLGEVLRRGLVPT